MAKYLKEQNISLTKDNYVDFKHVQPAGLTALQNRNYIKILKVYNVKPYFFTN